MHYHLLADLNIATVLDVWASRLITASWQGGTCLVLAWLVCRFFKELSAEAKCWIWRIAYLKFALILVFGGLLELPVLQPPTKAEHDRMRPLIANITPIYGAESTLIQPEVSAIPYSPTASSTPRAVNPTLWIFVAWLIGLGCGATVVGRQFMKANRLVRGSSPIKRKEVTNLYRVLCSQLKISKTPRLAMTQAISTPMIVGAIWPTILIPRAMLHTFNPNDLRMILAHELGHAKRRDLAWNWLLVAVRTVFFFHPLVWLTQSKIALDQEIACDHLALTTTNSSLQEYGNLLVKCSASTTRGATRNLVAVGAVSSFKSLKERILEMNRINHNQKTNRWLSLLAIVTSFALLAPIQLVAQQSNTVEKESSATDVQSDRPASSHAEGTATASVATSESNGNTERRNVNVSVSANGLAESIKVLWKNNRVAVTYATNASGSKKIKKYSLKSIDELEQQNEAAHRFYERHVSSNNNATATAVGRQWIANQQNQQGSNLPPGFRPSSTQSIPDEYRTQEQPKRQWRGTMSGAAAASSSSSGSSSSGTGMNGQNQTQNSRSNAAVSAGSFDQLIEQVKTMMDQTDDPAKRQSLQAMLDQLESQTNNQRPNRRNRR